MFEKYHINLVAELGFALVVALTAYVGQTFADTNATTLTSANDLWAFLQVVAAGGARVALVTAVRFIKPVLEGLSELVD